MSPDRFWGARSSTSRLNKKLKREKQVCESAGAGLSFTKDPSTFNLTASLMPNAKINEVEALIWKEIDSLATTPVLDYDLQKIKNKIVFEELTGNQHNDEIGGQIAIYDNYHNWHYINQWNQLVMAVTAEDIMRVVNKYLKVKNYIACYSHPDTTAKPLGLIAEETDDSASGRSLQSQNQIMNPV
jgi:predicted Zn-dependent peptidase